MSLDLGAIALRLTVNNQIPAGLRTAQRDLQQWSRQVYQYGRQAGGQLGHGFGTALGTVGGVVEKASQLTLKAAKWGALGFGALGAAGIAMGVKVASGNEQAKISFTTMLGSAQKANAFLRQLQKFAADTPFEFPELQTAASSLISVGVKAKDIIPIMTTLGNTTAGMGTGSEGIKRATVALQQMNAAGKIQAQDLNQLRDAGIPVYDLLSAALGKSKKQVADLVNSGDLAKMGQQPVDALMAALKTGKGLERFAGLMEKQSHSLAGMWSTLKDTLGQGLASAVAPAFPLIKQGLESISAGAAKLFGWVGKNRGSLETIFRVAGSTLHTFGRIVSTVFGSFMSSFAGGQMSVKSFADFLETHQGAITEGLIAGAKAALWLGRTLATGSSMGLRAFAVLVDGMTSGTQSILELVELIARGELAAFGWIPGLGPKLKAANDAFLSFTQAAVNAGHGTAAAARAAADGIDGNVIPAIDKAQGSLDKLGNTEIAKARLRDTAAKAAQAIRNVGTDSDGAQVKLKHFSDISHLGADEQDRLRGRLSNAKTALRDQIAAMQDAHASQGQLTAAWKKGKERLYDEFIQMGLSKEEARKLAKQYAGIPPKVKTKIEQPGMATARTQVEGLHQDIGKLPNKNVLVKILTSSNYKAVKKQFDLTFPQSRESGGPIQNVSGHGVKGKDSELVLAAPGEHMWTDKEVDAVGGHGAMYRMRADARAGRFKGYDTGGEITRNIVTRARANTSAALPNAADWARPMGRYVGEAMSAQFQAGFNTYARKHADAGGVGPAIDVSHPSALTTYHGKTFTRLFAAGLHAVEMAIGRGLTIYQGGFRPTSSFSGSTHNKDAVDIKVDNAAIRAFRRIVGAMGDRTGLGHWMSHAHGVPAPGHGYPAPSAAAQYRDYVRRGGAGQSLNSPWGLWAGTSSAAPGFAWTGEKAAELVVNPQLRKFSGGERVLNGEETGHLFTDAARGRGWRGAPLIGELHEHFPASTDPQAAAEMAGSNVVAKLSALAAV